MSTASLIGLNVNSGVPLFIRHVGDGKPPPYALIGSLNGVHVFGDSQGVNLCSTWTSNSSIFWKTYHDTVRLILIHGRESSAENSDNILLDLAFSSMVLVLGLDALTTASNIERLKRDIRPCYPILDELLNRIVGSAKTNGFSHLTNCADCVLAPDHISMQGELDNFVESADSTYGCMMMSNRIIYATKNFWSLSNAELVLLPLLVSTNTFTVARDVPIYLPNKSPNVPFRMLVTRLTGSIAIVTLCGPTPPLADMVRLSASYWTPFYQILEALCMTLSGNYTLPITASLDPSVLGFLLVNYDNKRCISRLRSTPESPAVDLIALIGSAYRSLVGPLMQPPATPPDDLPILPLHPDHSVIESYLCVEGYRVYMIQACPYHLFAVYPLSLPLPIVRRRTQETLNLLTKGKTPKV